VTLLLGTEEYTSEGASIKKAQHAAAADALVKTCFEHPPPKTQRVLKVMNLDQIRNRQGSLKNHYENSGFFFFLFLTKF
jgi:hypothetical protein